MQDTQWEPGPQLQSFPGLPGIQLAPVTRNIQILSYVRYNYNCANLPKYI